MIVVQTTGHSSTAHVGRCRLFMSELIILSVDKFEKAYQEAEYTSQQHEQLCFD